MADELHRGYHSGRYNLPDVGSRSSEKKEISPALKNLGNNLSTADRLIRKRDINPELNALAAKIPAFKQAIKKGKLSFQAEIPGYNSKRAFLGFKYKL